MLDGKAGASSPQTPDMTTLPDGIPLGELLALPALRGVRVLAGDAGLERVVKHLNVMTRPDILPWIRENELLLTTGYPLSSTNALPELACELDRRGLAGFGIKFDKYTDHLPEQALRSADEMGLPILEIPYAIPFDDILSQVIGDIASRQAVLLARSDLIHRTLMQTVLTGGGLTEITTGLAQLLEAGVAIVDRDGQVLAQAKLTNVSEYLAAAGLSGTEFGQLDDDVSARFLPGFDVDLLTVPIPAGTLRYGYVVAVGLQHALPQDSLVVLERGATVAALEITKGRAVRAVEQKHNSDFLHDLFVGRSEEPNDVRSRAKRLDWDLDRPLIVVVTELDARNSLGRHHANERVGDFLHTEFSDRWAAAVRARDPGAAAAVYSEECIAIIGAIDAYNRTVDSRQLIGAVAEELQSITTGNVFTSGISSFASSINALPEAYRQASRALNIGRDMHGPGATMLYDDLGIFRILSLIEDSGELASFVYDTLGPVMRLRAEERDDLLRTLNVLIDCNMNIKAAAPILHFHYNTVRYRITKLERFLGPFTVDRHLCHRISLALQVIQLHGRPAGWLSQGDGL